MNSISEGPSTSPSHPRLFCSDFAKGEGDDPTRLTRQYLTACLASTQFIPPRKMLKFLQDKPDLTEDMKVRLKVTERYYENSQLAWVNSDKLSEVHQSHSLVRAMDSAHKTLSDNNDPLLRQTGEDPNVLRILEGSIGFLCTLYGDIRNLIEYRGVPQLNEAVCRPYVDRLVNHLSNAPIDPSVDMVTGLDPEKTSVILSSHEQYIGLPRNEFQSIRKDLIFATDSAITELAASSQGFTSLTREWCQAMIDTPDEHYTDAISNTVQLYQAASKPDACPTIPTTPAMKRQYLLEPYQVICDSIVSIYIPDVFPKMGSSFNVLMPPPVKDTLEYIGGAPVCTCDASERRSNAPKTSSQILDIRAFSQMRNGMSIPKQADFLAQVASIGTAAATPGADATSATTSLALFNGHDLQRDLYIPTATFVARSDPTQALNLNRIQGSAGAKFFATLGLREMEIYGFVLKGFAVTMTASYAENIRTKNLRSIFKNPDSISQVAILDGNATTFDLTDAVQLVNFAVTLIRLRVEHVPKVLDAFGLENLEQINELPDIARNKTKGAASWKRAPRQRLSEGEQARNLHDIA